MTLILIFSGLAIIAGIVLLRKTIKGKLVSDHPHCQSCKFDLVGLELDRNSVCPECGQPTIPDTPMVMPGLRKRRPGMVMLAIAVLFIGCLGIAWPKVSQLPAIKNIDWYAKFPESMLLKLEGGGNKNALQTINDRAVDGSLSTEGFSIMIERAFANEADSTVEWDKRWGEILYQACVQDMMSDDQLDTYIMSYLDVHYTIHDIVAQRSKGIAAKGYESHGRNLYPATTGGATGYSIQSTLMSYGIGKEKPFYENTRTYFSAREVHVSIRGGSFGSASSTMWIRSRGSRWLELERGTTVQAYVEYKVDIFTADTQELVISHRKRVEQDVLVVSKLLSQSVKPGLVPEIASKLRCLPLKVPRDPEAAKAYKAIADSDPSSLTIISTGIHEAAGLLGTFWLNNGIEEIQFIDCSWENLSRDSQNGFQSVYGGSMWLDYFIEHQAFWDKVIEDQRVTLIYSPDPSMLEKYPFNDYIIAQPIIWPDVGIDVLIPEQVNVQRNGITGLEWDLVHEERTDPGYSYRENRDSKSVVGELMEEE